MRSNRAERVRFDRPLRYVYQFIRLDAFDLICFGSLGMVKVPAEWQAHPEVVRRAEEF